MTPEQLSELEALECHCGKNPSVRVCRVCQQRAKAFPALLAELRDCRVDIATPDAIIRETLLEVLSHAQGGVVSVEAIRALEAAIEDLPSEGDTTIRTLRAEVKERDERLNETVIDDAGTAWTVPTADAYMRACKALHAKHERIATLQRDLDAARADGERLEKLFAENVAQYDEAQRRLEAAGVAIKTLLEMCNAAREKAGA